MSRLDEIKHRLVNVTPGPWECHANIGYCGIMTEAGETLLAGDGCCVADAILVAHAPTDIAWLVAEVERLEKQLDIASG